MADVTRAGALKRGTASQEGRPAVVLSIQKAPGTNTLELTRQIDAKLDQVEPGLPHGMKLDRHVMRQSDFINRSLDKVTEVCRDAAIIVAVILALFLMNVRATVITLVTIPTLDRHRSAGAWRAWRHDQRDDAGRTCHRDRRNRR